jgi:hypothetical protein
MASNLNLVVVAARHATGHSSNSLAYPLLSTGAASVIPGRGDRWKTRLSGLLSTGFLPLAVSTLEAEKKAAGNA